MLSRFILRNFSSMAPRALVVVSEGSEELEAIGIIDILRRGKINVTVASIDKDVTVKCARGSVITADTRLKEVKDEDFEAIVLPGGMPGAEHFQSCSLLVQMLKEQKKNGGIFAAICASPAVVFAHHKLLDGLEATCYPSFKDAIQNYVNEKVVVSGNCITSQGPGTVIDFALELVKQLCNEETSKKVAKGLIYN